MNQKKTLLRACAAIAVLAVCARAAAEDAVQIRVLSNRADLLSGGDALVEIKAPASTDAAALKLTLNGADVSAQFARRDNGRIMGLLQGLKEGANQLTARLADSSGAEISLTNYPKHGPVFSGPQVLPWVCDTESADLGPSESPYCEVAAPIYQYFYKPKSCVPIPFPSIDTGGTPFNCLLPEYNPEEPPTDVDTVTTDQGKSVPFIVRVEIGTLNRGIYKIAALYDPAKPDYQPWAPQDGYNGKVLYTFGGDCTPRHGQGQPIEVRDVAALSRGFAVMTTNLNILGQACNDAVNAESVMMLKEYFTEHYGEIRYTIGNGASGGSIQQQSMAGAYPGLLNGIQPAASFPDFWQVVYAAQDCHLLNRVFALGAVQGYALPSSCLLFDNPTGFMQYARVSFDPENASNCQGGAISGLIASGEWSDTSYVYNAQSNPQGVRCTLQDYNVAIWGRRESDGFANRAFDNVGVQYGLQALQDGLLPAEEFVRINESIGGIDIDWNFQPQRSEADPAAVEIAYRSGRVNTAHQLDKVPVIDLRGFSPAEIHTDVHSYSMRARMDQAYGHHDNQIIWTGAIPLMPDPTSFATSFVVMDQWLAAMEADTSSDPLETKVLRHKPAEAVDACWFAGGKVTNMAVCEALFPHFGTPRTAAGGPLADDIIKCQLKPLRAEDYPVSFSEAQWARLQAAFPTGVCDYSQPGVAQLPTVPWLSYMNGPGGQPLGEPPVSKMLGGATASGDKGRFGGALDWSLLVLMLAACARRIRSAA